MKHIKTFESIIGESFFNVIGIGDIDSVKRLINSGKDINVVDSEGNTPLMYAAWNGQLGIASLLIDNGADLDTQGENGNTALMYAVWQGKKDIFKILSDAGANWNLVNDKGYDFSRYVNASDTDATINDFIELCPEKYKDYLIYKKAETYNL